MVYRENAYRAPPGPSWLERHRERVLLWSILAAMFLGSYALMSFSAWCVGDPTHRITQKKVRVYGY
jgi:hypothetical protein